MRGCFVWEEGLKSDTKHGPHPTTKYTAQQSKSNVRRFPKRVDFVKDMAASLHPHWQLAMRAILRYATPSDRVVISPPDEHTAYKLWSYVLLIEYKKQLSMSRHFFMHVNSADQFMYLILQRGGRAKIRGPGWANVLAIYPVLVIPLIFMLHNKGCVWNVLNSTSLTDSDSYPRAFNNRYQLTVPTRYISDLIR